MKTLHSIAAIASLITFGVLAAPGVASAENVTGAVVSVRTCPESGGGQKVVIHVRSVLDNSLKRIYLGVEPAGSTSLTSVAMASLLSGRRITIEYSSNTATQCATIASYGNGTNHWMQLNQ